MNEPHRLPLTGRSLRDFIFSVREPAPAEFLTRRTYYSWLVVGTTCVGAFIGQVDASIVQLALPTLERTFDAHLDAVSWVAIGYVLAFAAILPVFARLAEISGRKVMYLLGFALFASSSTLCGFAPSLRWLIALRTLQGASGAMLGANSVVILVAAAGPERRGRAMGIFAAAQAVGISVGPTLGGLILGALSWRWIFWVNVPFAFAGLILGWMVVPKTTNLSSDRRFDWSGALLLIPALTATLLALTELRAWGPLSARILVCAAAALILMVCFVRRERSTSAPLIDLHLFRSPAFSGGALAVALSYAMLYGMFFAMSFALVRGYHDPPLAAGLRMTIIPIALSIVAPLSGALYEMGPRLIKIAGMVICAAALIALTEVMTGAAGSLPDVMLALAAFGVGLGMFIAANNTMTISAAPAERSGQAGGLLNLMRVFGTGLGVATASSVLAWRIELMTGLHERTVEAPEAVLLAAIRDVMLMLVIFAIIAGATALLRSGDDLAKET